MPISLSTRRGAGPQDLVDLLCECHERIRRFVGLARKASTQPNAPPDQVVQACADVERYFREALPLHVADEEYSVEPCLRGLSPDVDLALDTMAEQHRQHAPKLELLLSALADLRADPQRENARDELAAAANDLEQDFAEHLALEERVVFPAIRQLLSDETQARIIDELRQRRRHDR